MFHPPNSEGPIQFSVIVPVYNGAETISACLSALVSQNYPKDCFEIVVVNDGSTDETLEIAKQFPVKVITLTRNEGRIVARQVGAREARCEILVFNDIRVIPEPDLLQKLAERNYFPLIPNVVDYDGRATGYSRLFYLLRRKIYYPYYPLFQGLGEIFMDSSNFDEMPKGMTTLACPKSVWLTCQPNSAGKHVNDDTRILHDMVKVYPILRTAEPRVRYLQRSDFWSVVHHMYRRGPRFFDYYLVRGGRFYYNYLIIWVILVLCGVLAVTAPTVLIWAALAAIVAFFGLAVWLSEKPVDCVVVLLLLPSVILAFGLGILHAQILQYGETLDNVRRNKS